MRYSSFITFINCQRWDYFAEKINKYIFSILKNEIFFIISIKKLQKYIFGIYKVYIWKYTEINLIAQADLKTFN